MHMLIISLTVSLGESIVHQRNPLKTAEIRENKLCFVVT